VVKARVRKGKFDELEMARVRDVAMKEALLSCQPVNQE